MKSKVMLGIAAMAALAASAASAADLKTETRSVGAFDTIDMRGAAKVDISVGAPQSLKIEAEPEALTHITTEVRGTTLIIEYKGGWWNWNSATHGPVHISIALPKLAGYSLGGAGDTRIIGLNGGTTGVSLNGAGSVKASGKLDRLSLNLNGTGEADFSDVPVDTASVSVNGVGSAHVNAKIDLTASVNGVGSVVYDGAPQHLTTAINGVGSVRQAH